MTNKALLTQQLHVRIDKELHRLLRVAAAEKHMTIQELVEEWLWCQWNKRKGVKP